MICLHTYLIRAASVLVVADGLDAAEIDGAFERLKTIMDEDSAFEGVEGISATARDSMRKDRVLSKLKGFGTYREMVQALADAAGVAGLSGARAFIRSELSKPGVDGRKGIRKIVDNIAGKALVLDPTSK